MNKRYVMRLGRYGGHDIIDTAIGLSYAICTSFKYEDAQRIVDAMNEQAARDIKYVVEDKHESI